MKLLRDLTGNSKTVYLGVFLIILVFVVAVAGTITYNLGWELPYIDTLFSNIKDLFLIITGKNVATDHLIPRASEAMRQRGEAQVEIAKVTHEGPAPETPYNPPSEIEDRPGG